MIVLSGFDFKAMSKYDARLQEWYERTGGQVDEVIDTKLQSWSTVWVLSKTARNQQRQRVRLPTL